MTSRPVVFIGLGHMGQPMALHLLQAGYNLWVYDLDGAKTTLLAQHGAKTLNVLDDLSFTPDMVLITMLPGDRELREVVGRWQSRLVAGVLHLSFSTISPETTLWLSEVYRQSGAVFLGCNVLGRPNVAMAAQLTIFLSGDETAKACIAPLLRVWCAKKLEQGTQAIYDFGPSVETANVVKIAANAVIAMALEALGEIALLLRFYGIVPSAFFRSLIDAGVFAGHVYHEYGVVMIGARTYTPALFPVPLGLKDVRLARETAEIVKVPFPLIEIAEDLLTRCQKSSHLQRLDWSVMGEVLSPSITLTVLEAPPDLPVLAQDVLVAATLEGLEEVALLLRSYGIRCVDFFAMLAESGLFGGSVYQDNALVCARYYDGLTASMGEQCLAQQHLDRIGTLASQAGLHLPMVSLLQEYLVSPRYEKLMMAS